MADAPTPFPADGDAARWRRVQDLFHEAAERPAGDRRAFVESRADGDAGLVADVLALLDEDARGLDILDDGMAKLAHRVLVGDAAPAVPGHAFGPYRLTRVLGEGGMGVVYLGVRDDLGSVAAVKILRDAWLSPARRERFAAEQRALARLNHPAIARLYDADTLADGTPWFVMEYVDGLPLTAWCAAHAPTVAARLTIFRTVCEAVRHAHQHAIIHRDLKPSNILVTADGAVKLLDFGIARQLDSVDVGAAVTRTGLALMTPAYAAPEQILGDTLGTWTDVYALGVILYELLAGSPPYDLAGRTPSEVAAMVVERQPERPSAVARRGRTATAGVPAAGANEAHPSGGPDIGAAAGASRGAWADLDVLCLTAMHKEPARRYHSVDALLRDVDHFLRGEALDARPDGLGYRAGKFTRRHWRAVTAAGVTFAAVVALTAFYTWRLAGARNAAVAQTVRAERLQRFMTNLFQGGDEAAGPADSLRVVTLLGRGERDARTLSSEPAVQADLFQTLGTIYEQLGDLDRADTLLAASLGRRRALFGASHPDVARSLVALGLLRADQSRYDDAERLVRDGLTMTRAAAPPDRAAEARATTALGQVLEDRGSYDAAIGVLEGAVRLDSVAALPAADVAATLTELANSHFYAGHYAVADSMNRRVVAVDRQLYGDRHPHVADDLINLGAVQFQWGHYADAERFDREALAIDSAWYGMNHPETASALTMLGRAQVAQKHYAEATAPLRAALGIQERVYGGVHPRVASALNELGIVAMRQGRLDEAESDFRRMADIYRTVYHDRHYLIGVALSNLAGVYQERKEYHRAEATFRDVLRRYREVLSPDHQLVGVAHVRLGRVLLRDSRYAEAERETMAGYRILTGGASGSAAWLRNAREDLIAEYGAQGRPARAAAIRVEMTHADSAAAP